MTVTGKEAVKVWIFKALMTPRFRYEIYTWAYGSEFESLIGQAYTPTLKEAEAPLVSSGVPSDQSVHPSVSGISVDFSGSRLTVAGTADTIYGEVRFDALI